MRQGPNNRRSRGRSSNPSSSSSGGGNVSRRQNVPLRHQTFDSNGPDVRIRGNAWQVNEKYLTLARDAASSGDRIQAENYLQHAEHYFRIINQIQEAENRQRDSRGNGQSPHLSYQDEDDQGDGDGEGEMDAEGGEDHAQMNA